MALLPFSSLALLLASALLAWALAGRIRTVVLGNLAVASLLLALGLTLGSQLSGIPTPDWKIIWSAIDGTPVALGYELDDVRAFLAALLLLAAAVSAGGMARTLGTLTHSFGLLFAGLLLLTLGGLLTLGSTLPVGPLLGLGISWLGGTIMQQTAAAHHREATIAGIPLLLLSLALLLVGATPALTGGAIRPLPWLFGCVTLIVLLPRWGTSRSAPLLLRAPVTALGLPLQGGILLLRYAETAAPLWARQTTAIVAFVGAAALILAVVNALTARRLANAFAWQIAASLSLIVVVFGTGQEAAGPIATGLLGHAVIVGTALALAVGQLERAARTDEIAALPPLPQPLRRAGLAYALAALSLAGMPPLLGYQLRQVVLVLAVGLPWLPPLLLASSTLLALSFLPTLVAFFRRPVFRSPLAAIDQRGGGWPLALMLALLIAGLVPQSIWQWLLGDPSVPDLAAPPWQTWLREVVPALLALLLFGIVNRTLRRPRSAPPFTGGEPLDEEPGWTLPFGGLRAVLRPLVLPDRSPFGALAVWIERQQALLAGPLQLLEQRYYLAVVVVSLISILLLAAQ